MKSQDPLQFLGESLSPKDTRAEALKNLRLIIRIRWIVSPAIFLIMFASSVFGVSAQAAFSENQLIVNGLNLVVILILNIIYAVLVKRISNLQPLILFQLLIDVVHFTLTIYKTGSVVSPFSFLYFMVIFATSILLSSRATYLVAGIVGAFYSGMVLLEFLRLIPHQDFFSPLSGLQHNVSYLALSWSFSVLSYFAFAVLASYLTGLLRQRQAALAEVNSVLDRKVQTHLLLFRTSRALNSHTSVKEVVEVILTELLEFLNLDRALLYLNVDNQYLHLYMAKSRSGEVGLNVDIPLKEGTGLTARAALSRQAFNVQHPADSPYINRELAERIGLNPFALAPLTLRDTAIGVVGIDRSFENGLITDEEFQILQIFANQTAITIASLQGVDKEFGKAYHFHTC